MCLMDKTPKIRTNAENLITIVVNNFGLGNFETWIKGLSANNSLAVKEQLRKLFGGKSGSGGSNRESQIHQAASILDNSILDKIQGSVQLTKNQSLPSQHPSAIANSNEILGMMGLKNNLGYNALKRQMPGGNESKGRNFDMDENFETGNSGAHKKIRTNANPEEFDSKMLTNISLAPVKQDSHECPINYANPTDEFMDELRAYFRAILGGSIVDKMFSIESSKVSESLKQLANLRNSDFNKFKNHFSFLLKWVYLRIFDTNRKELLIESKDFLIETYNTF
jgi:hypothetical protein